MPKNISLKKILLIGSGPIVIGQGCEFDYSGVQACKALAEEGYAVVLINSNPATIMTDPEFAVRTYIEPITPEIVAMIIEREKVDAVLPTVGGQTALNVAIVVPQDGTLQRFGVQLIGASATAIRKGEDRQVFKEIMLAIGLDVPVSGIAHNMEEALAIAGRIERFPLIIRPAFTLGGGGGGIANNYRQFKEIVQQGLTLSPVSEILVEESLLGWKEFEMEVMRDCADNCVVVCSIENMDPMGVHTGDSITVAPIQTLTDKEYQSMRDASFSIMRAIGVETGGANIQFGVNPQTGRMVAIEMNPRVSRSSALASKATGFPIAKIAAKLAVGYSLDELKNDITRKTSACFEPAIDYVVTKIPRFTFEKFPMADSTLTTQMKSVGEVMAIGRTLKESLQKAIRSLEIGRLGLGSDGRDNPPLLGDGTPDLDVIKKRLQIPSAERIFFLRYALQTGFSEKHVSELSGIDPWFIRHIQQIVDEERSFQQNPTKIPLRRAKKMGFSDCQLAFLSGTSEMEIRNRRKARRTVGGTAACEQEALAVAAHIGYPVLVRPSFVLGGRAMEIIHSEEDLRCYVRTAVPSFCVGPLLVDRFLEEATEVDIDCISDGSLCVVGGIMEHIEQAGIHSGDSACMIPSYSLSPTVLEHLKEATKAVARELNVVGLMNIQFAVKNGEAYVLEVNPRASRTIPFVSKAIGVPLAKLAAKVMVGRKLRELGFIREVVPSHFSVKEAVFPFARFPGVDILLGPEMRSTGEVMGIDRDFGVAYAKAQISAQSALPSQGNVFISVRDIDKDAIALIALEFCRLNFRILSTYGTTAFLGSRGVQAECLAKLAEGYPNVLDRIQESKVHLIINTPSGRQPRKDEILIRMAAVAARIPVITTLRAAQASLEAIRAMRCAPISVRSIQEYHAASPPLFSEETSPYY
ncbi:MAG: carbamoyl-phosphate synthase large subunit [Candidatus Xiphinematobacter sp.]|nr:MAG: carbamoyl-phosphate synthase large subunit [Candidatus Xiphinematobacter sp.]